jgi:hypothetical protein
MSRGDAWATCVPKKKTHSTWTRYYQGVGELESTMNNLRKLICIGTRSIVWFSVLLLFAHLPAAILALDRVRR